MEELELLVEQMLKEGKSQDEITSFIKSWDANSTPKKPNGPVEKTATSGPKPTPPQKAAPMGITLTETDSASLLGAGSLVSQKPIKSGIGIAEEKPKPKLDSALIKSFSNDAINGINSIIADPIKLESATGYTNLEALYYDEKENPWGGLKAEVIDNVPDEYKADVEKIINATFNNKVQKLQAQRSKASLDNLNNYIQQKGIGIEQMDSILQSTELQTLSSSESKLYSINKKLEDKNLPLAVRQRLEEEKKLYRGKNKKDKVDLSTGMAISVEDADARVKLGESESSFVDISNTVNLYANAYLKKGTDRDKLKAEWQSTLRENYALTLDNKKTYDAKVTNKMLRSLLVSDGYKIEPDGTFKNLPLDAIVKYADYGSITGKDSRLARFLGLDDKIMTTDGQDLEELARIQASRKIALLGKKEALKRLYILNEDITSIDKNKLTQATEILGTALVGEKWYTDNYGFSGRKLVTQAAEVLQDNDINLSKEEKEYLEYSFGETLTEVGAGFAPIALEFALLNKARGLIMAGTGVNRLMEAWRGGSKAIGAAKATTSLGRTINKAKFVGATLMMEEAVTQTVGLNTGAGAAFAGVGLLMPIKFRSSYNQLNTILNKGLVPGFTGVVAGEAAKHVETGIKQLKGEQQWQNFVEENYNDLSKVGKDALANFIVFGASGFGHIGKYDLTTTKRLNEIRTLRDNAMINALKTSDPNAQKYAELYNEVDVYIKSIDSYKKRQTKEGYKDYLNNEFLPEINKKQSKRGLQEIEMDVKPASEMRPGYDAEYIPSSKNSKAKVFVDEAKYREGKEIHEISHALQHELFGTDATFKENFVEGLRDILKKITLPSKVENGKILESGNLLELIDSNYSGNKMDSEYFAHAAEYLAKPEVYSSLVAGNAFYNLKNHVTGFFEQNFGYKPALRTQADLINWMGRYVETLKKGKGYTTYAERLQEFIKPETMTSEFMAGENKKFASQILEELGDKKKDIFSKAEKAYKEYSTDPAYKDNEAVIGMMVGLEFEPIVKKIVDKRRDIPGFELYRDEIVEAVTTETRPGFNGIPDLVALYRRGQKLITFAKKNLGDQEAINKKAAELGISEKRIADFVEMAKGTKEEASLASFIYGQLPNRIQGIIERKFPELGRSFELTEGAEGKMTEAESITVEDSFVGEGGFYDMSAPEVTIRASKEKAYKILELPDEFITKINAPVEKFLLSRLPDLEARTVGNFVTAKGEPVNVSLYDTGKATIILEGSPITIKARTQADVAAYLIKEGVIDADNFVKSKNFRDSAIEYSKNAMFNILQDYVGGTLKKGTVASAEYADFVKKSYSLYKNYLSQSNINKRFSVFAEPVIDKVTGKQARAKTAIGEPIFKKKDITPEEWYEYFVLGAGSKSGRIDGRRRSLLESILEDVASDQIVSKLFDKEFKEVFEKRQGEISDSLIDNYAAIMAKNLDRGIEPTSFASRKIQEVFEEINEKLNLGTKEELSNFITYASDSKDKLVIDLYNKLTDAIEAELREKIFIKNTAVVDKMNQDTKAIFKRILSDEAPNLNNLDYEKILKPSSRVEGRKVSLSIVPKTDVPVYENIIKNAAKKLGNYDPVLLSSVLGGQGKMAIEIEGGAKGINGKYIKQIQGIQEPKGQEKAITRKDFVHSNDPGILKIADLIQSGITKGQKFEDVRNDIIKRQEKTLNYLDSVLLSLNESLVEAKNKSQEEFDSVFKVVYNLLKGSNHFAITRDYSQILYLDTQAKGEYKNAHTEAAAELNAKILAELYNGTLNQEKLNELKGRQVSVLTEKLLEDAVDKALGRTKSGNLLLRPVLTEIYREAKANSNGQIINVSDALQALGKITIGDQFAVAEKLFSIPENKFLSDIVIEKLAESFADQFENISKKEGIELAKSAIDALVKPEAQPESFASKELELKQKEFALNEMIERKKGIRATEKISKARASQLGQGKGKFEFFLPPNAQDFHDMLYNFYGKGKQGEADMQFMRDNLIIPFETAENKISTHREDLAVRFKLLNKKLKSENVKLDSELVDGVEKLGFTVEQAARVYIWSKLKYEIPNISAVEQARLINAVRKNQKLRDFADGLMEMTDMGGKYPEPDNNWFADNIKSELYSHINKSVRAKYLEPWQENINAIFSKDNLNKIEAVYGKSVRFNLEQAISRMKTGRNRPLNLGKAESAMLDYINGSNAVTMFANSRSAVLQTISSVNFLNWSDNNIYAAGKTLADPKNFAQTYLELWNSDFLRQRRSGLQIDITESEIAEAIGQNKNKAKALFAKLMQAGYKPTQMADSFAIAIGGTPFYINRTKKYMSEGFSEAEAKAKAFIDFRSLAEEHQQSSRQDRVSNIQTGVAGRLVFSFNNTPFQMTRIMKRAALDLINRRGSDKENISKLIYYSTVQNLIFYTLQQGLFAAAFGDEDEKTTSSRYEKLADGMISGFLRGTGLPGAVLSTVYLAAKNYQFETEKGYGADYGNTINQLLSISPPLSTKTRSVYSALKSRKYYLTTKKGQRELETKQGFFEDPLMRSNIKMFSSLTNAPLSRIQTKMENLGGTMDDQYGVWQRAALALGWDKYSLGLYNNIPLTEEEKKISAEERSKRAKESADKRKIEEIKNMATMTDKELIEYLNSKKK